MKSHRQVFAETAVTGNCGFDDRVARSGIGAMSNQLAIDLMKEFARSTGLTGHLPSRRYLWTDAFAVCNFLGIYRQTNDQAFLDPVMLATSLVPEGYVQV